MCISPIPYYHQFLTENNVEKHVEWIFLEFEKKDDFSKTKFRTKFVKWNYRESGIIFLAKNLEKEVLQKSELDFMLYPEKKWVSKMKILINFLKNQKFWFTEKQIFVGNS